MLTADCTVVRKVETRVVSFQIWNVGGLARGATTV